ncbi:MAG: sigma-70 family RNA polymerase sigma factor [Pseudomonadota bacterium]
MDEKRRRFEALAMPHLDAAYNLARWLTRGGAEADDIVQEAMLRAFRSFDGFRGEAVRPWLLAIVRNCHRAALEQRKRHAAAPLDDQDDNTIAASDPTPEASAIERGDGRELDKAIATLPEEFREVVILRELEEMSYRDIAAVTGTPIGTVMSRLARGRALLKAELMGGSHGV